jgi:hypothetical protein
VDLQPNQFQDSLCQDARLGPSQFVSSDTRISPESVFSDGIWKMEQLVTTPGIKEGHKEWDFRRVPGFPQGFALSLAEYAHARLYRPVETHEREGAWLTVHNELLGLSEFSRFCERLGLG